jgi:hypothetical protein
MIGSYSIDTIEIGVIVISNNPIKYLIYAPPSAEQYMGYNHSRSPHDITISICGFVSGDDIK